MKARRIRTAYNVTSVGRRSHASDHSKQAIACHAGEICVVVYEASLSRFDVFHVGAGQALSFFTRDTEKAVALRIY